MEAAAKTWSGQWWKTGGGGAPWDSIVYDPKTDLVSSGTGNGAPWPAEIRSPGGGDHLYLSSIVALDAGYRRSTPGTTRPRRTRAGTTTTRSQLFTADLDHRWADAPCGDAGAEEWLLLRAGCRRRASCCRRTPTSRASTGPSGIDLKTGRPIVNPEANYGKTGKGAWSVRSSAARTTGSRCRSARRPAWSTSPPIESSYAFVAAREDDNPMGQKLSISFAGNAGDDAQAR